MSPPIFIVGTPRSGTTLAARILGRHSRIFMPGETHFFDDVYAARRELGDSFDSECRERILTRVRNLYGRYNEPDDQAAIDRLLDDPDRLHRFVERWRSYPDVLTSLMETRMRDHGKERWGNQTPRDIFNIDEILSFYPDAKIIVCVRDVRDFLVSYRYKWKATSPDEVARLKRLYHPVITSLLWNTSMRLLPGIKHKVPADHLHILRYEDLVGDPQRAVPAVCSFVGEAFEDSMLEVDVYASSHGTMQKGIFSTSVGRWRDRLSKEETWVAQTLTRGALLSAGYQLEHVDPSPARIFWIFITAPWAFIRGLNANRHKRGPLIPYLYRRLKAVWGR